MSKRWFIAPVLGVGTKGDSYRLKVRDYGVDYSALIPSNPNGTPKFTWGLAICNAGSFSALDADGTLTAFPGVSPNDLLGSFSQQVQNNITNKLTALGVDMTGIGPQNTVRDVLLRVSSFLTGGDGTNVDVMNA